MKRLVRAALVRFSTRWLVGTGVFLVGVALVGLALGAETTLVDYIWLPITLAVSYTPLALFVLRTLPEHPVGWLMLGTGLLATLSFVATAWSRWTLAAWLSQWLWWPPFALIPLSLLLFPDGHLPTPRWRFVAAALVVTAFVTSLALAAAAVAGPRTLVSTVGTPAPSWAQALAQVAVGGIFATVLVTFLVGFAMIHRWRRAGWLERRQIACLAPSAALLSISIALSFTDLRGAWIPAVVSLPLAFTFAILQYRLFDLDMIIHRGLVWILLSLIAVSIYATTVAGLTTLLSPSRSWTASLFAGAAVAAILLPAERLAQRAAQRLLYGQRDDPYRVLVQAGRHVEAIRDPLAVLPQLVETLVNALRVPSAAMSLACPEPIARYCSPLADRPRSHHRISSWLPTATGWAPSRSRRDNRAHDSPRRRPSSCRIWRLKPRWRPRPVARALNCRVLASISYWPARKSGDDCVMTCTTASRPLSSAPGC